MNNQEKEAQFSYVSPEKQQREALLTLIVEVTIGVVVVIVLFFLLNFFDILPYKKMFFERLATTTSTDETLSEPSQDVIHKNVPFLHCPVSALCGKLESLNEPARLELDGVLKGVKLLGVGNGKVSVAKDGPKTVIKLLLEERGMEITYEVTGFEAKKLSLMIKEGDELGEFNGSTSSLAFSVQSTVTNRYIEVVPFEDKYLTNREGL